MRYFKLLFAIMAQVKSLHHPQLIMSSCLKYYEKHTIAIVTFIQGVYFFILMRVG